MSTSAVTLPRLVAAALALVAVLFAIGWSTRIDPATKPYLKILGGGFILNYRIAEMHYGFTAVVQRPLPIGSIIEAQFEDPAGGGAHVVSTRVSARTTQYSLRSPPVRGVVAGKSYHVEITVIDRERTQALWRDELAFISKVGDEVLPDAPLTIGPGYARNPRD